MKLKKIAAGVACLGCVAPALATNGMNMEGYGPIATSMGGASMAYDHGTAGMINNPATLGFMKSGTSRFDIAVGGLHPNVNTTASNGAGVKSGGDAYFMPAAGYFRRDGNIGWGVGVIAQGGMGTEYDNSTFWGVLADSTGAAVAQPGLKNRSELGVGRFLIPMTYAVSDQLTIGGSLDYVWATMDIQWLVDGAHFADFFGGTKALGSITMSPVLAGAFPGFGVVSWGYFDFTNSNDFSGRAKSTGWAGNIGFTYKVDQQLTIGGTYHAKTRLGDMTTDSNARLRMLTGGFGDVTMTGKVTIKDFQWPETYGIGMSYQATDAWQIVADYKRINWASVMKNFKMTFELAGNAGGFAAFNGQTIDVDYYQNWKNQNVFMIGASYKATDKITVRFGGNFANNPVPDANLSPLFPAIVKNHYTLGGGYQFDKSSSLDFSLSYAPKVTATNSWSNTAFVGATSNQTVSHSQTNWQLLYSHRF